MNHLPAKTARSGLSETCPLPVPASQGPLLHSYEREIKALQIQMKEEENKTKVREEMIKRLNSDKVKLEQQVAKLEELLAQKETQAKRGKKKRKKKAAG